MDISGAICCHSQEHSTDFRRSLGVLRKARLKITQARQAILRILIHEHGPFTMEQIHAKLSKGACDLVTVYRCLANLEEVGLVHRCEFGDGSSRFEFVHLAHHHHHIICRKCRRVETLGSCAIQRLEKMVRDRGYSDVTHTLEFFGVCPICQTK